MAIHDRQSITPSIRQVDVSSRLVELHDPANLKAKRIEIIREMLLGLLTNPGRRSEVGTSYRRSGIPESPMHELGYGENSGGWVSDALNNGIRGEG